MLNPISFRAITSHPLALHGVAPVLAEQATALHAPTPPPVSG
jgi:hypothetical protein